mgnify:CR=1 FL=1
MISQSKEICGLRLTELRFRQCPLKRSDFEALERDEGIEKELASLKQKVQKPDEIIS